MSYKPSKLGQADPVFGLWSECISIGLCVRDYRSLRLGITIYAALLNTQAHLSTGCTISPTTWAKSDHKRLNVYSSNQRTLHTADHPIF